MTTTDPGIGMPDLDAIEWLNADDDEHVTLTDRERLFIQNAYRDGYTDGHAAGYRVGGYEALRAATALTTLLSNPLWQRNIDVLAHFADVETADHLQAKLWHDPADGEEEAERHRRHL